MIKRKININNYICKSINKSGYLHTYDKINRIWSNGSSYNNVSAYVKNPFYPGNGINKLNYLSHNKMLKTINELYNFHLFVREECIKCDKSNVINIINIYIDEIETYILNGGNNMFSFINTYLGVKYNKMYNINDDKLFINFLLDNNNIIIGDFINKINAEQGSTYTETTLYNEYLKSNNKFKLLTSWLELYYYIVPSNNRDVITDLQMEVNELMLNNAIEYYNYSLTCELIPISPYVGNYEYDENVNLKITLQISNDSKNLGDLTSVINKWVEGKRYYIGDIVDYDGKTYILTSNGESNVVENGYMGSYNALTKEIYFDEVYLLNGLFNGFKMDGNDFTHWKRNIADRSKNPFIRVLGVLESQLNNLKSYRKDASIINFFDTEGVYKKNIKFNVEKIDNIEYYSVITDIITNNISNGHDTLTYKYIIAKTDSFDSGIEFEETFHRYSVGVDSYVYNFDEIPSATYLLYNGNNINKYNLPLFVNNIVQKFDEEVFNYTPSYKEEYLLNIIDKPRVDNDVNIDRGSNYMWDKHIKLGEIRTLEDLGNYGNGFFNLKENNE